MSPRVGFVRRLRLAVVAVAATALPLAAALPAAAATSTGPVQPDIIAAATYALANPTVSPPGTNDFSCTPNAAHPNPVVLSNGTFANAYDDWAGLSGQLHDAGYCVFVPNLGGPKGSFAQTYGPIADTARGLAAFTDSVLTATGADKVDVVGHSQGGMNPRYWIKNLGGADRIGRLIALAPSNHGTDFNTLLTTIGKLPGGSDLVKLACPACAEQTVGSDFLTQLNAGGETDPGVQYTVLGTRYDEVVTPYTSAFLAAGPNVHNVLLQDVCGLDHTDHLGITYDPIAGQLVLNALDPAHQTTPHCQYVPPVFS